MPRRVSEISSGGQFSRSSEEGRIADSQTRVFKVLLNPGEGVDIQEACGVYIGNPHPQNQGIYCTSFSAQFDGESRTVLICTFQYGSTAAASGGESGEDPKSTSPDVRPANWTTSTSLVEVPANEWYVITSVGPAATKTAAHNSAGDMYDGISYLTAMVNISVDQLEPTDPTRHISHCGKVNKFNMRLGSLTMEPRTLMFRGVSCKPTVEPWGNLIFRGWIATYEFAYRSDTWDLRIPQSGMNVKAANPVGARADQDIYGSPLKHTNQGKIKTDPITELAETLFAGDRARAMVRVHSYDNGGASQLPSAQPIALNDDGTPRKGDPLVKRYCPYDQIDLAQTLQLRLT